MKASLLLAAVVVMLGGGCAAPEKTTWIPFQELPGAPPMRLEAQVYWPAKVTPAPPAGWPIVVFSHGSPREAAQRANVRPHSFAEQLRAIADTGVVVIAPIRRGYGQSDGDWVEHIGGCNNADYLGAGRQSARDLRAAVQFAKALPGVDTNRVVLSGVSAGGFASHALASEADAASLGIRGVINIAGGRGSRAPGQVCQPERLVGAFGEFARSTAVPALWMYADNDLYFAPTLVARMRAAVQANGGKLTFVRVPASGNDGHHFFRREPTRVWLGEVQSFLAMTLK
jgi:dienelactone hydrolase